MNVVRLLTATLQLEMRCIYFHSRTLEIFFRSLFSIKIKVRKIHNSAQSDLCMQVNAQHHRALWERVLQDGNGEDGDCSPVSIPVTRGNRKKSPFIVKSLQVSLFKLMSLFVLY